MQLQVELFRHVNKVKTICWIWILFTSWIMTHMAYSCFRPHHVPLLSAKNRKGGYKLHRLECAGYFLGILWATKLYLKTTAYPNIDADHVNPFMATVYPSSDSCFQQSPYHRTQTLSVWFLKYGNELTALKRPTTRSTKTFEMWWNGIHIMHVRLTNLQQLREIVITVRTKILEECFQHLVESVPRRTKAKQGPTRN